MPKKHKDHNDPTPATHGDLVAWGDRIVELIVEVRDEARENVKMLERKIDEKVSKGYLDKQTKKIIDHFDKNIKVYVENKASALLGVKHDEVREIQRQAKDHEERITILER